MEITEIHTEPVRCKHCANIYSTIAYFSIFRHPLTRNEIAELIHFDAAHLNRLDDVLEFLINKNQINYHNGFYFLNDENSLARRLNGEIEAQQSIVKAKKYSRLISKFPFVRGVFISGSLSKNYMDDKSDIDYFIVTKPSRLWICRTLLILYKKIFLFNSHHFFCLNYFVDENNITINDRNIFTATELLFLLPMYGKDVFEKLAAQNNWVRQYYPNKNFRATTLLNSETFSIKNMFEKILSLKIFNWLDDSFLHITVSYWKRKFKNTNLRFNHELRSFKGVSKHHPNGFENKIVAKHSQLMHNFNVAFKEVEMPA